MQAGYEDFLALLRAFVHDQRPELSPEVNYVSLLLSAGDQSLDGIIAYSFCAYPDLVVPGVFQVMNHYWQEHQYYNNGRIAKLNALMEVFNEQEIPYILIKGAVVRDYYRLPGLRSFNDIDFVIRPEDRKRVHRLMISLGYQCHTDWEPVYAYRKGKEEFYEIHTELLEAEIKEDKNLKTYFRQVWDYAIPLKDCQYQLKPEFHFLYLLTHIAKHVKHGGAGIRMYLDIAAFIKFFESDEKVGGSDSQPDWEWVQRELVRLDLDTFANFVMSVVEEWFQVESPWPLKPVDRQVKEDFLQLTIGGSVFGYEAMTGGMRWLKADDGIDGQEVHKRRTLVRRLFPSAKTIESRYTYLARHKWLLPLAWIHRIYRTRRELLGHLKQAREILSADKKEVARYRRLQKAIGLSSGRP